MCKKFLKEDGRTGAKPWQLGPTLILALFQPLNQSQKAHLDVIVRSSSQYARVLIIGRSREQGDMSHIPHCRSLGYPLSFVTSQMLQTEQALECSPDPTFMYMAASPYCPSRLKPHSDAQLSQRSYVMLWISRKWVHGLYCSCYATSGWCRCSHLSHAKIFLFFNYCPIPTVTNSNQNRIKKSMSSSYASTIH